MSNENLYTPDCIRTFTGKYVNVFDVDADTIVIEDICHALSMQCRFGGHLTNFYSVGQHSVEASYLLPLEYKLDGLLHDASEAYLLDIPRPIKEKLSNYKEIEKGLMEIIADKFGFEYPLNGAVKRIDEFLLNSEWDIEMLKPNYSNCWSVQKTKDNFIAQYQLLRRK